MATPISFHPITMRLLTMMLVASLLLTGIMVAAGPDIAHAEFYCYWTYAYRATDWCGASCGVWMGLSYGCWDNIYKQICCDAYHCWETGSTRVDSTRCGCPC